MAGRMKVEADGFLFDFPNALKAFKFDEKHQQEPTGHDVPMKAVDVVVEFEEFHLYVEVKNFHKPDKYNVTQNEFIQLKSNLKYKYRDSYLCRHAQHKVDKPIRYICLLNLSDSQNNTMRKGLKRELPTGIASPSWKQAIVDDCQVVNLDRWNANFPWPVTKIPKKTG